MGSYTLPNGHILTGVHGRSKCVGEWCLIHNPMPGDYQQLPLIWRSDRGIFERICQHGCGHPDPNSYPFWEKTGQMWQGSHGCCVVNGRSCCADWGKNGN